MFTMVDKHNVIRRKLLPVIAVLSGLCAPAWSDMGEATSEPMRLDIESGVRVAETNEYFAYDANGAELLARHTRCMWTARSSLKEAVWARCCGNHVASDFMRCLIGRTMAM